MALKTSKDTILRSLQGRQNYCNVVLIFTKVLSMIADMVIIPIPDLQYLSRSV